MEVKTANVTLNITLKKAREWYISDNGELKELALRAFPEKELRYSQFSKIKTFKDAVMALDLNIDWVISVLAEIEIVSKASAAIFQLNIIRKALNLRQGLCLTKNPKDSYIHYPYNPLTTESSIYYKKDIDSGKMEIIGKIKSNGEEYNIIGGDAFDAGYTGLGNFYFSDGVGYAEAHAGFLGCASKEIAEHFGKYFGMLITEAKFGDLQGFEIIEDKYRNAKQKVKRFDE